MSERPVQAFPEHQKTISELKKAVSKLGISIDSLVLYGSVARGQDRGIDSDIDILVIGKDETKSSYEKIRALATDIDLKNSTATSIVYFSRKEIERDMKLDSPFLAEVMKEGVPLYDNGTFERLRAGVVKIIR